MSSSQIFFASDHAGYALKEALMADIREDGYRLSDLGCHSDARCDYPEFGKKLAESLLGAPDAIGVAICGSGIGISIAANRYPQIRAALCHSGLGAELARRHNHANVLALGARLIGLDEARECLHRFIHTPFDGGRHTARVEQLNFVPSLT